MERLLRAGLTAGFCAGRVPMGATPPLVGADPLLGWGEESPGDEVEVRLDCCAPLSKRLKFWGLFEAGDELLLARDRCCWGFGDGPVEEFCWPGSTTAMAASAILACA